MSLSLYKYTKKFFLSFFFFLFFLASSRGLRDLSSLTRDQTRAMAVKVPNPNHWTTREFQEIISL